MSVSFTDKSITARLTNELERAKKKENDSLEKLSTGVRFTSLDPRPADRAIAEKMEHRLRSLNASKRLINDDISLLQTAESSMAEVGNAITRMKEINVQAMNTTVSDRERRFLIVEYDALYDELNRVARTVEYNGIPLLNGGSEGSLKSLTLRIDAPYYDAGSSVDLNVINLEDFASLNTTPQGLGLKEAKELLSDSTDSAGISIEDVQDLLTPEDTDTYASVYDQAISRLSAQRAVLGSIQSRLSSSLDFIDIYEENIAAAKSRIADTDYAREATNLVQAKIQSNATTSLLAQTELESNQIMKLLSAL